MLTIQEVYERWQQRFPEAKAEVEIVTGDTLQITWSSISPISEATISRVRVVGPDRVADWVDGETPPRSNTVDDWLAIVSFEEHPSVR